MRGGRPDTRRDRPRRAAAASGRHERRLARGAGGAFSLTGTSRWEEAGIVGGFSTAAANQVLLEFVRTEIARCPRLRILDVGCGAARNAAPMAAHVGTVVGTDVSWPMLNRLLHLSRAGRNVFNLSGERNGARPVKRVVGQHGSGTAHAESTRTEVFRRPTTVKTTVAVRRT